MSRADPNLKLLELASLESRKHGHFYKDEVSVLDTYTKRSPRIWDTVGHIKPADTVHHILGVFYNLQTRRGVQHISQRKIYRSRFL